jgi:hypothetical protein
MIRPNCLILLLLAGCAATSNPSQDELRPVEGEVQPTRSEPLPVPERPASPQQEPEPQAGQPVPQEPAEAPPARAAARGLTVGSVGGEPIDVREFLSRLWMQRNSQAREVLENLVFARLTEMEAQRLSMTISTGLVDKVVDEAYAALRKRLQDSGSSQTPDEYIRTSLDLDPRFYERHLRSDAIIQLLAERCVRAWAMENPRRVVRLIELADLNTAEKVQSELEAGASFEELAKAYSQDDDAAEGGTALVLVRSENYELSRLAFATEVGAVGGPLFQQGRYLMIRVDERFDPRTGTWKEIGEEVERSLVETSVDNLEFVQWRAAMVQRYQVDLEPFLLLVEAAGS